MHIQNLTYLMEYQGRIMTQALHGPTTSNGATKDGCTIFWTYVSQSVANVLCTAITKLLILAIKHQFHVTDIFCTETREKLSACKLSTLALLSIECDVRMSTKSLNSLSRWSAERLSSNSWTGNTAFSRAMLCRVRSLPSCGVCPSVCLLHAGIVSKRLNLS